MHLHELERRFLFAAPAPTVSAQFDAKYQRVVLTFDQDVSASLSSDDLKIYNLTAQRTYANVHLQNRSNSPTVTEFFFSPRPGPDGNYRLLLSAGKVQNSDGVKLANDFTFDFFSLAGDADHNRRVDIADFTAFFSNFGSHIADYTKGDFDGNETVDVADFTILFGNFGKVLSATDAQSAAIAASVSSHRTNRRDATILRTNPVVDQILA